MKSLDPPCLSVRGVRSPRPSLHDPSPAGPPESLRRQRLGSEGTIVQVSLVTGSLDFLQILKAEYERSEEQDSNLTMKFIDVSCTLILTA